MGARALSHFDRRTRCIETQRPTTTGVSGTATTTPTGNPTTAPRTGFSASAAPTIGPTTIITEMRTPMTSCLRLSSGVSLAGAGLWVGLSAAVPKLA
jgi:hypothetical protein